eukprot:comp25074_c0_seq1/m.46945 comp25074_c0_seq1/g.46945  ORF comp25074_c0_seq1/g.46945 comp25074_c0_seq1/m.46945 type:complete len:115 (-) comp25074_c0_seq1:542-886(-)
MGDRNYALYRKTTLGQSLSDSLDELIQTQQLNPQLAMKVLLQFDRSINTLLATRARTKTNFKGSLHTYRFCDNVWTFILQNANFRSEGENVECDLVKIVACDGKGTANQQQGDF